MSASAGVNGSNASLQELELDRRRPIGGGRVDAGAQRVELGAQARLERRSLALGCPPQPQGPHEAVGLQPRPAGDLRQPAAADAPVEVDLPETVLAVAEALAEPQVVPRAGADVRNPPAVTPNLDPSLEPLEPQASLGAGQGAPEKLPPQARGGRRCQRREPPAEERETPRQRAAEHGGNSRCSDSASRAAPPGADPPRRASPGEPPSPSTPPTGARGARRPTPRRAAWPADRSPPSRAATSFRSRIRRCSMYSSSLARGSVTYGPWPGQSKPGSAARRRSRDSR